jgi:CheY-like chemotaxis protein
LHRSDGQQALDVLQAPDTRLPDAIFTDVYMPEMDGIEFLLRLSEVAPDIPAVVVSGGGVVAEASHVLTDADHLGAAATLIKPFTPSDLYRALDQVLPGQG